MNYGEESVKLHAECKGKIESKVRVPITNRAELSLAYTPGVAQPCLEIQKDYEKSFTLTRRWNTVAVVTDGTAVLGLGDIGPEAGMPVMEGKAALFKEFGDVDAIPICVKSKDPDEIVRTIQLISGSFGGINLEDISAPRCFEIEEKLKKCTDIPIFHDDQHGTAITMLAAVTNALRIVNKNIDDIKLVLNGAGAAGTAIAKLLLLGGVKNLIMCDKFGAIYEGNPEIANFPHWIEMSKQTNPNKEKGTLKEVLHGADVFVGVSAPNLLNAEDISHMNKDAIVFACANPVPEIMPEESIKGGARIVASGRSDDPNQLNNLLVFPGLFRGVLDARAKEINVEMKLAAAKAIAGIVSDEELSEKYFIPNVFNKSVAPAVAKAVYDAAHATGVARW